MDQPLPSDKDAERALLSSCLHAPAKVIPACEERGLADDWWSNQEHARIYQGFRQMLKEGRPIDLITASGWFHDHKADLGLYSENLFLVITELFTLVPTASNWAYYLGRIQETAARRIAILECLEAQKKFQMPLALSETFQATGEAFKRSREVCAEYDDNSDYDRKAMEEFLNNMEDAATGKYHPEFFPTSFETIDEECGGLMRGELMLIRALKGCGKSLTAQAIIQNNLFNGKNTRASLYSFEMPYQQVMRRMVASIGRVSLRSMRHSRYSGHELRNFASAMTKLMASGLSIYDTSRLGRATPNNIFSSIRKRVKNEGLSIVALDHMHLVRFDSTSKKSEKRADENYHEFASEFKAICLEEKIVGILLAQENSEGGTFGGSQVETDVDWSISLNAVHKMINGKKRVVGVDSYFVDKSREGGLLGRKVPLKMEGEFATITETKEAVTTEAAF